MKTKFFSPFLLLGILCFLGVDGKLQASEKNDSTMTLLASGVVDTGFYPAKDLSPVEIEKAVNAVNPYILYRKGSVAEYAFQYNGKQVQFMGRPTYIQQIVFDEKIENGLLVAYVQSAYLNKKHEPTKGIPASFKEYTFPTEIDTAGIYHYTHNFLQDVFFLSKRNGYGVLFPGVMKPGMKLQCSTLYDSAKNLFGGKVEVETIYSDWQVVGEDKITVPAGTFDCVKIIGRLVQKTGKILVSESITCWMARGVGMVQYETINDKSKTKEPFVAYLNKLELK